MPGKKNKREIRIKITVFQLRKIEEELERRGTTEERGSYSSLVKEIIALTCSGKLSRKDGSLFFDDA